MRCLLSPTLWTKCRLVTLNESDVQTPRKMFKEKWPGTYIRVRVQQFVILSGSVQVSLSRHCYVGQVLLDSKDVTTPGKIPRYKHGEWYCHTTEANVLHETSILVLTFSWCRFDWFSLSLKRLKWEWKIRGSLLLQTGIWKKKNQTGKQDMTVKYSPVLKTAVKPKPR